MDFAQVWDVFHGSLFDDELVCDYTEILHDIDRREAALASTPPLDAKLSIYLLRAIHSSLTGDQRQATKYFERMRECHEAKARWQLRCAVWELYQELLRQYPPVLPTVPGILNLQQPGENIQSPWTVRSWNDRKTIDELFLKCQNLASQGEQIDQMEYMTVTLLRQVCECESQALRICANPPQATMRDLGVLGPKIDQQVKMAEAFASMASGAIKLRDRFLKARGSLLKAMQNASSSVEEEESPGSISETSTIIPAVRIDAAWPCVFTRPTSLDIVLSHATDIDLRTFGDEIELRRTSTVLEKLVGLCDQSLAELQQSSSTNGLRACLLHRKACLRLLGLLAGDKTRFGTGDQIGQDFTDAKEAFGRVGNCLAEMLAKCHTALSRIITHQQIDCEAEGKQIGTWATETGNSAFAILLGTMCARLGRNRWNHHGDITVATGCLKLAIAILDETGHWFARAQVTRLAGIVFMQLNNFTVARTYFERTFSILKVVMAEDLTKSRASRQLDQAIVDGAIDSLMETYFGLQDKTALENFFADAKDGYQKLYSNGEQGWELPTHTAKFEAWKHKIDFRAEIRKNRFGEARAKLIKMLNAPTPRDVDEVTYWSTMMNLAFNYGRLEDARKILDTLVTKHNLFNYYAAWNKDKSTVWTCFETCINCGDYQRATQFFHEIENKYPALIAVDRSDRPYSDLTYLVHVARWYINKKNWFKAIRYLECACAIAETQRAQTQDADTRKSAFGHSNVEKALDWMVWACISSHKPKGAVTKLRFFPGLDDASWIERALFFAERGKARVVSESIRRLQNHKDVLKSSQDEGLLAAEGVDAGQASSSDLTSSLAEMSLDRRTPSKATSDESDNVLDGADRWLRKNTLIIAMVLCHDGLGTIFIHNGKIIAAEWNAGFGTWDAQEAISTLYERKNPEELSSLETIDGVMDRISALLLGSISPFIEEAKIANLVFVPSGDLTRVPFAALKYQNHPLIESFSVSQAPSVAALRNLHNLKQQHPQGKGKDISVIARAYGPDRNFSPSRGFIGFAAVECLDILNQLPTASLEMGSDMSAQRFLELYCKCSILHIATHGKMNYESPLQSRIELKEKFFVENLENLESRAELVFLSACLTGLGYSTLSDDMTGFQAQVLSSGASAFAGVLWAISDMAAFFFVHFFYKRVVAALKAKDTPSAQDSDLAQIFSNAQRDLYHLTKTDAEKIIGEMKGLTNEHKQEGRIDRTLLHAAETALFSPDIPREGFRHPGYWAPFIFVGASSKV